MVVVHRMFLSFPALFRPAGEVPQQPEAPAAESLCGAGRSAVAERLMPRGIPVRPRAEDEEEDIPAARLFQRLFQRGNVRLSPLLPQKKADHMDVIVRRIPYGALRAVLLRSHVHIPAAFGKNRGGHRPGVRPVVRRGTGQIQAGPASFPLFKCIGQRSGLLQKSIRMFCHGKHLLHAARDIPPRPLRRPQPSSCFCSSFARSTSISSSRQQHWGMFVPGPKIATAPRSYRY